MPTCMADKRLRLSFDARSEVLRRAVYIAAAMTDRTHSDVLSDLIEAHLAKYVVLAERAIAEDDPRPSGKKKQKDG